MYAPVAAVKTVSKPKLASSVESRTVRKREAITASAVKTFLVLI